MNDYIKISGSKVTFFLNGRRVTESKYREVHPIRAVKFGTRKVTNHRAWPILSDAAGCHPKQVAEAEAVAAKRGVPTKYTRDGRAIFTDRAHRKAFLKAHHMNDRSGGYGD